MDKQSTEKRFALLIDADNVSAKYLQPILDELSKYGTVTYKRIYGDWTLASHVKWKKVLLENSITPIQQFGYTQGKNATDSAMIIDAMDILYTNSVEGFCIVSSDSDFTRLAVRLREGGLTVIGMGEKKTPVPFRKACDIFTTLELLVQGNRQSSGDFTSKELIEKAVVDIIATNQNNGKGTGLGEIGSRLQKRYPDFDVRNYGTNLLSRLLDEFESVKIVRDHNNVAVMLTEDAEVMGRTALDLKGRKPSHSKAEENGKKEKGAASDSSSDNGSPDNDESTFAGMSDDADASSAATAPDADAAIADANAANAGATEGEQEESKSAKRRRKRRNSRKTKKVEAETSEQAESEADAEAATNEHAEVADETPADEQTSTEAETPADEQTEGEAPAEPETTEQVEAVESAGAEVEETSTENAEPAAAVEAKEVAAESDQPVENELPADLAAEVARANDFIMTRLGNAGDEGIPMGNLSKMVRNRFKRFKVRELGFQHLRGYLESLGTIAITKEGNEFIARLK